MRKIVAIIGAGALTLTLTACGTKELPQPAAATNTASAALSSEDFDHVLQTVLTAITEADTNRNADELASRASGPYLQFRSQEYVLKNLLADSYDLDPVSTSVEQLAVTSNETFPRFALTIMQAPKGSNLKTINVYQQGAARDNWKLWSSLPILPGQTVPAIKLGDTGATTIARDSADGLVASPNDVLAAYAAYNSSRTQGSIVFGDDALYTSLSERRDANAQALNGAGEANMTFAAGHNGPVSFATDDGGALVIAQMDFSTAITITQEGATIKVGSTIGALASGTADGEVTVSGTLTANYSVMVAFRVPAAGSDSTTVQVVGASDPILLSVTNG